MRRSTSLLHLSRLGWFVLIGAAFAAKDACAGGGRRPDPPPPATAAPAPANSGKTSLRERPEAPSRADPFPV